MRRTRRAVSVTVLTSLLALGIVPSAVAVEVTPPEVVDAELELSRVPVLDVPEVTVEDAADPRAATTAAGQRSASVTAPIAFTGLWAELPAGLDQVRVRTSVDAATWTDWEVLEVQDGLEAPDPGTAEADAAVDLTRARTTELLVVLDAQHVQVEAAGDDLAEVTLGFLDADGLNESAVARLVRQLTPRPAAAHAATVPPEVRSRASWGAKPYRGNPSFARNGVEQVVIHHTAGANNLRRADGTCDRAQVAATLRGVQYHHQVTNGWSDIGYNVVIDPCGGIWEGRQGGLDRAVIGAHAAGANTGSTGVSVLGHYGKLTPNPQILAALDRVVGWKAGIHGIDTTGTVTRTINGSTRTYPTVVGHTNVGATACPGRIMDAMGRIRANARVQAGGWQLVADGAGAGTFSDVFGNVHARAIEELVERQITQGFADRTFRPTDLVTRAQVATFLAKSLDLDPIPGAGFDDVDPTNVHAGRINALTATGIIGGYPDGTFRPNEPLRREHMAAILARALELPLDPDAAATFSDVVGYAGEIGAVTAAEVSSGHPDGTFKPKASVTRAQMATFLVNALRVLDERAGPDEPTPTPDPTEPTPGPTDPTPAATPTAGT